MNTFKSRTAIGLASDLSRTWMSWTSLSPSGLGAVISSATSLAASSNLSWELIYFNILREKNNSIDYNNYQR